MVRCLISSVFTKVWGPFKHFSFVAILPGRWELFWSFIFWTVFSSKSSVLCNKREKAKVISVCVHSHQWDNLLQKSVWTSHIYIYIYNFTSVSIHAKQPNVSWAIKTWCTLVSVFQTSWSHRKVCWRRGASLYVSCWPGGRKLPGDKAASEAWKAYAGFSLVVKWSWSTRVIRNKLLQHILLLTWKVKHILTVLIRRQM